VVPSNLLLLVSISENQSTSILATRENKEKGKGRPTTTLVAWAESLQKLSHYDFGLCHCHAQLLLGGRYVGKLVG
jgi:hypothetical protein